MHLQLQHKKISKQTSKICTPPPRNMLQLGIQIPIGA